MDKLKKLLAHWIEHNKSHKEDYEKWARRLRPEVQPEGIEAVIK